MKHEIELKLTLAESIIPTIRTWLAQLPTFGYEKQPLENSYYDNAERFFALNDIGLRVRKKAQRFEMTLKTGGKTIGGLHIRPEYSVELPNETPDLQRLAAAEGLPFQADPNSLQSSLHLLFKTDFIRERWLVVQDLAQIEICLDQGDITNSLIKENICELALELIEGNPIELIQLLRTMPIIDGIYFSALSKVERGYLLNDAEKASKDVEQLLQADIIERPFICLYQIEQYIADYLRRLDYHPQLLGKFLEIHQRYNQQLHFKYDTGKENWRTVQHFLASAEYFKYNLNSLERICRENIK
ncbi:inorganic triphosphatase [Glaesserella sp.]|uniref:CYTH domain-containing protein n=1 Tax=Glaesserella sp. TaxID=2094731 RepID=UPI00359FBBCD